MTSRAGVTIRRPFTVKGMIIRERQNLASYGIGYLLISESVQVSYDPDRFANTMISRPASVYVTY